MWLNWRDIRNPDAGGAEVFTHEIMRRLASKGYDLTLFTSRFSGALSSERIDGINIVREGGKYTTYLKSKAYYKHNHKNYDMIIDEINTRPFLTPTFVKEKPILALFHQMAKEFWFYEMKFPLNYLGYYYLEKKWLSYYVNVPTVTISNSSKKDLAELGFKNIFVVPQGLGISPLKDVPRKESVPTIVFVGRLKKVKLPHHAVQAFSIIKKTIPNAQMWVIGDGYMLDELKKMNIRDVTYFGHVKNDHKYELMSRAHIALVPAVREGWGLVVTEANAMGTPVIAYDVHGLRDSVQSGFNGILVESSIVNLAKSAITLLSDDECLNRLSKNALQFAKRFNWEATTEAFENVLNSMI